MEFRILGPVEVRVAGQPVDVGHARQRSVLAVLLLDLNQVVPAERLIDRVWGENPPASVRNVLSGYVARLRGALAGEPGVVLAHRPGGYVLEAAQEQVDRCNFRRQVADAGAAAGNDERAAALLRGALGMWHGAALAGLSSPWLGAMRDTLELQKLAAVLDLNDIALRQGRHSSLISELTEEAAVDNADERIVGQLMLALYRSGRQAEALRWFEQTRQRLADEFGADPGPGLQALHQQILRADRSLALPEPASRGAGVAPRELPADVSAFTGRTAELVELERLLTILAAGAGNGGDAAGTARVTVISAVSGTAGVGKTALAVRWAHQVAERFPDGQLYVNLRGYDSGKPMPAVDALARFLRALGVTGHDIPPGEDERAARYRSLLAGRRMLVVLDNAAEAEQVRPLLPGTPGCMAVVTSRDALAGLVARDGARRLDLDMLPPADAVSLLRALIGGRVDVEPESAGVLAAQCAALPLALRVAAELAVARPAASLADLTGELADQERRLDVLDAGGDPRTAVRAVFSWSYQHLHPEVARAFRLAGLHPGGDFDAYAVAALTGTTIERARHILDLLTRAHLIQPGRPGRHGMHDLLRAYAAERAIRHDAESDRRTALTRLFDYYLHTAAAAMGTLYPAAARRPAEAWSPAAFTQPVTDAVGARAWLDAQRATLVAVAAHTADHGWPGYTTRLATIIFRYLEGGGHYPEIVAVYDHARRAARHTGDRAAEAEAHNNASVVDLRQGRYQQAGDHLQQALSLYRQAGHQGGEARALGNLGILAFQEGRYQQASEHHQHALARYRQTGHQGGEARTLGNLGLVELRQGHYQRAASHFRRSLALAREVRARTSAAYALANLGLTDLRQGRYQQAGDHLQQSLALFRETADPTGQAYVLTGLGAIDRQQGRYQQASSHHRQALALCRQTGDQPGEAEALNSLGEVFLDTGQPEQTRKEHIAALGLASQIGDKYEQARAHNGIARAGHATGDHGQARHHWQQALALYTELGTPEASQVRDQLAISSGQCRRP